MDLPLRVPYTAGSQTADFLPDPAPARTGWMVYTWFWSRAVCDQRPSGAIWRAGRLPLFSSLTDRLSHTDHHAFSDDHTVPDHYAFAHHYSNLVSQRHPDAYSYSVYPACHRSFISKQCDP